MAKNKVVRIDLDRKAVRDELLMGKAPIKALEEERDKVKNRLERLKSGGLQHMSIDEETHKIGKRARAELVVKPYGDNIFGKDLSWGFFNKYPLNELKTEIFQEVRKI